MITVTDSAVKHLRTLLADRPDADRAGLRLSVENGGCSGLSYGMEFGESQVGDETVEQGGVRVFVDAGSAAHLKGSIIDYHDGLTGTGFRIQNPNAKRTCGCGTSFEPEAAGSTQAAVGAH